MLNKSMKLFQIFITPSFRNSIMFSLKSLRKDSMYGISNIGKRYIHSKFLEKHGATKYLSISKFYTIASSCRENNLGSSKSNKRSQRKRTQKWKDDLNGKILSAVAYCSAEGYRMQLLLAAIENQGLYKCLPLPEDAGNNLHLCSKDESSDPPSHIYIFSEGCVVFWNVPKTQQMEMLKFLKPYEINSYDPEVVNDEKEDLDYTYSEDETCLNDGCVVLNSKNSTDLYTYTFSDSLAQSVKLGILEEALEKYSDSIEWVTDKMKNGEQIKISRKEIFAKRGELFSLSKLQIIHHSLDHPYGELSKDTQRPLLNLRLFLPVYKHAINLSSDLLDTPDFYWDRKNLEILYHQTCNYLDIPKRTRTMNVRLSYCSELVDLLVNHMNDEHHVRLEWMIIVLIMVEVVFECIHFLERFSE